MNGRETWSAHLINASMVMYIIWLMLPAVQVNLRAVTGGIALVVFAVGVLLDWNSFRLHWKNFIPRVLCVAALPLLLVLFLNRGSEQKLGYLAQQVMFWFPLLWCVWAAQMKDRIAYYLVFTSMIAMFSVTMLTTIGWLIEDVFNIKVAITTYARALGSGSTELSYAKILMRRNIGGYDFIYAAVLSLPFIFYLAGGKGWKRWTFSAFYALELLMVVLSQYTFAIIFAIAITVAELLALALRKLFKRLSVGASLLYTLLFFALVFLLRLPLLNGLASLADSLQMGRISENFRQLYNVLSGIDIAGSARLPTYEVPWNSFLSSPLFGGIFSGEAKLGMHSEVFDMLAALGIIGTLFFLAAVWVIGRGMGKGLKGNSALPHLIVQWIALAAVAFVNTVFYSREIPLVICLCIAFAVWTGREKSGIMEQT